MSVTSGAFVRLKSEPSRASVVQDGVKVQAGLQMAPVHFSDGHLYRIPEQGLEPVTITLEDIATGWARDDRQRPRSGSGDDLKQLTYVSQFNSTVKVVSQNFWLGKKPFEVTRVTFATI